jgi:hypothetical protein
VQWKVRGVIRSVIRNADKNYERKFLIETENTLAGPMIKDEENWQFGQCISFLGMLYHVVINFLAL